MIAYKFECRAVAATKECANGRQANNKNPYLKMNEKKKYIAKKKKR